MHIYSANVLFPKSSNVGGQVWQVALYSYHDVNTLLLMLLHFDFLFPVGYDGGQSPSIDPLDQQ